MQIQAAVTNSKGDEFRIETISLDEQLREMSILLEWTTLWL